MQEGFKDFRELRDKIKSRESFGGNTPEPVSDATTEEIRRLMESSVSESSNFVFKDIPFETITYIKSLPLSISPTIRMMAGVAKALKEAGFAIEFAKRGEKGKRGDEVILVGEVVEGGTRKTSPMTQQEVIDLLKNLVSVQTGQDAVPQTEVAGKDVDEQNKRNPYFIGNGNASYQKESREMHERLTQSLSTSDGAEEVKPSAIATAPSIETYSKTEEALARKRNEILGHYGKGKNTEGVPSQVSHEIPVVEGEDAGQIDFRFKKPLDISDTEIVSGNFDSRFESEFGITQEQLKSITGIERLSSGQQKLVFENLRELRAEKGNGYLTRVWQGIIGKEDISLEQDSETHKKVLERLITNAATFGPKVHENEETGALEVDFVGMQFDRKNRSGQKQVVDAFNKIAHTFAKTPTTWQEDGIGTQSKHESKFMSFLKNSFSKDRKKYQEYEEIEQEYEDVKKQLAETLKASGESDGAIAAKLIEIEGKVYGLRFLQTSPETIAALKNNPDTTWWQKAGKALFTKENLAYAGLGFVGRMALTGSLGLYAAPLVASVLGGTRAWNKSAAELRERDRAAREGKNDTSQEALNIVQAVQEIKINGKTEKRGVTQKLQSLIEEYQHLGEDVDSKRKNELLSRIKSRVEYTQDKVKLNRINFGADAEKSLNIAKFFETFAVAQMIIENDHSLPKTALEERLEQYLGYREDAIQGRRRTYQVKKAAQTALIAGSFALAGRELAEYVKDLDMFKSEKIPAVTTVNSSASETRGLSMGTTVANGNLESKTSLEPYTIKSGDTLTKILKEQIPEIKNLDGTRAQENAIANILKTLSKEQLAEVGVRNGNIDHIYTGQKIDMSKLSEILESKKDIIENARVRFGGMSAETIPQASGAAVNPTAEEITPARTSVEIGTPTESVSSNTPEVITQATTVTSREQEILTTPKSVEQFKSFLAKGNISEREWSLFRNRPIVEIDVSREAVYGSESTTLRTLGMTRRLIESAGVEPKAGETVEEFLARGAKYLSDESESLKYRQQFNRVSALYINFDPERNYVEGAVMPEETRDERFARWDEERRMKNEMRRERMRSGLEPQSTHTSRTWGGRLWGKDRH